MPHAKRGPRFGGRPLTILDELAAFVRKEYDATDCTCIFEAIMQHTGIVADCKKCAAKRLLIKYAAAKGKSHGKG